MTDELLDYLHLQPLTGTVPIARFVIKVGENLQEFAYDPLNADIAEGVKLLKKIWCKAEIMVADYERANRNTVVKQRLFKELFIFHEDPDKGFMHPLHGSFEGITLLQMERLIVAVLINEYLNNLEYATLDYILERFILELNYQRKGGR